ncbi:MAG TPA: amino acid adenylation domain-containing protein [Puia sp.]|nr:amino acid adenylation domain-containing protein [Puia sp.]
MLPVTLTEILLNVRHSANTGVTLMEAGDREEFLSYGQLYDQALRALHVLQTKGIQPKDELIFQIEDNKIFLIVYWACILGGIVPVPLTVGKTDDHKQKLFNVWPVLNNPYLITSNQHSDRIRAFADLHGLVHLYSAIRSRMISETDIFSSQKNGLIFSPHENDIAFIQFSSGSTGNPKGVVLTHKNLITNVQAITNAARYTSNDAMLSWMPLTHDMGLIGFHINPLCCNINHFIMSTSLFIRRPSLWLDKVARHKISILCSPNFGYEYLIRHCDPLRGKYDWDLSSVRLIYNGAEPISEKLCRDFQERLSKYGLNQHSIRPVYGLAEASLAVTISGLDEAVVAIMADRDKLNPGDKIIAVSPGKGGVSFVNVGRPVEDCLVAITGQDGKEVSEEIIGNVRIKGANVTAGYYNNEIETERVISEDGWLDTGDLGFMKSGALYITGRAKDIIFINGRNYYPHDIESLAEEVEGIELNKIAVTGFFNEDLAKEQIIAFILHRNDLATFIPLAASIKSIVNDRMGLAIDRIIPVREIPRTTSGKLQRFRLLQQFESGWYRDIERQLSQMMETREDRQEGAEPENENEWQLLKIWRKILKTDAIGMDQGFFKIGGTSLKAAEMEMAVLKEFEVDLPLKTIYDKPTIRQLAAEIATLEKFRYTPISLSGSRAYYPMSSVQRRLKYIWEMDKSSTAYNIPVAFNLIGKVDVAKLENCFSRLIDRHDSLRTVFPDGNRPQLHVHKDSTFTLKVLPGDENRLDEELKRLIQPFDLNKGPLFRVTLLATASGKYILFADFHHSISDGVSLYNFMDELLKLYNGSALETLPVQYKDYVLWEDMNSSSEQLATQEKFWRRQLPPGNLPVLDMPLDFPRPVIFNTSGAKLEFELDPHQVDRLKQLAEKYTCTLHVLLFSIYNILLGKYTGQDILIIGIPVQGRRHPDLKDVQGMFVNNLAIRSTLRGDMTFLEFLQMQKEAMTNALTNQDYPFDNLVRMLHEQRDISRNPVFDTMFIYQDMGIPEMKNADFALTRHFFDPGIAKYDLSLEIFPDRHSMRGGFEYCTKLFKEETISRLARHFCNLITSVLEGPETRLSDLQMISDLEYNDCIRTFNASCTEYPGDKTIQQLFEEQAGRTPDKIAIEYGSGTVTYEQLNARSGRLAGLLREKGVGPGGIVGILLPASPDLITGILAVLKAGGCYLPIGSDLPEHRIRFLISDSRCKWIITGRQLSDRLDLSGSEETAIIDIDDSDLAYPEPPATGPRQHPHDLAYVIYTSGTTGTPKGVMIENKSLVNYISWAVKNYIKDGNGDFPLFTPVSFDLTITSIFAPLVSGNRIVIYEDNRKDLLIESIIADNKVDIIKLTPSHLRILNESKLLVPPAHRIKRFIVGGEKLEATLAGSILDKFGSHVEIYNEYGPTEATVGCMIHKFEKGAYAPTVPVGIPAANTAIYLLDKFLRPVPTGVIGEIFISGDGLAKGYLYREELTNLKFLSDPFHEGRKMYKTGDLARRLPDGVIEYIGRYDQQVKINGYRVELSEIEHHLTGYNGITEVVAAMRTTKGDRRNLYAYYINPALQEDAENTEETALRSYLADRLPHYMIPLRFIRLERIPLTENGKIDFDALPEPETNGKMTEGPGPGNDIERVSLKIWEEVLGESNLCVTDNFFELGGDSIKAVQIASRLFDNGIHLKAKDILLYHTIARISLHADITDMNNRYYQGIVEGERDWTPIESWFFSKKFNKPGYFNQSVLLGLKRKIDNALLQEAFNLVIRHHDGLRVNYDPVRRKAFYNNRHLQEKYLLPQYNIRRGTEGEDDLIEICCKLKNGFDIGNSLLLKAAIIRQDNTSEMLFITAHHLIIDGVSWRIFLEDLRAIYYALERQESVRLSRKTASLTDWQNELMGYRSSIPSQKEFWKSMEEAAMLIPPENGIGSWKCADLDKITGTLDKEETHFLLKKAHEAYNTNVPVLLNTALVLTLKEWTGRDSFVIEQENHGRHSDNIDLSRTIGWFTTMYPILLTCRGATAGDQIKSVKEQFRLVPDQGIGYGIHKYIEKEEWEEDQLTGIRFNYLGQFDTELNNELFAYSRQSTGSDIDPDNTITAGLEFNSMISDGELIMEISYAKKVCKEGTAQWLVKTYFNNLKKLLQHIRSQHEIHLTASDFDTVDLDDEELKALFY